MGGRPLPRGVLSGLAREPTEGDDVQLRMPDVSKAQGALGCEATTTLDEMLVEVIPWIHAAMQLNPV